MKIFNIYNVVLYKIWIYYYLEIGFFFPSFAHALLHTHIHTYRKWDVKKERGRGIENVLRVCNGNIELSLRLSHEYDYRYYCCCLYYYYYDYYRWPWILRYGNLDMLRIFELCLNVEKVGWSDVDLSAKQIQQTVIIQSV